MMPAAHFALHQLLLQRLDTPFRWGASDCFLLAADATRQVVGRDPAAGLRGSYATALQARRALAARGGWLGLLQARWGHQVPLGQAQEGDTVLLRTGGACCTLLGHAALGVVWEGAVAAQGAQGLVSVPLANARSVWRVVGAPA